MNDRDKDALIVAARLVADQLDRDGCSVQAAVVRRLCTSRAASRAANRRLYADNLALRRQIDGGEA